VSRLRSFHRRLLESFFAEGEPVPFAYTEHIDLLSGDGGFVSASPEPFLFVNSTSLVTRIFSLLPPPTPEGYVARLTGFSIQCGSWDTFGAPGTVDVTLSVSAMLAPDGVITAEPVQEVLSAYGLQLTATDPPPAPNLDVLATYSSEDFSHQSGEVLPFVFDATRGTALYLAINNLCPGPIWIWKLTLSWDFVAVP
jgi:hypothetical protein